MKLRNRWIALCLVGIFAGVMPAWAGMEIGKPLPNLAEFNQKNHLPDQAGRVVLVDFWATWCAPCRASFHAYDDLQREFGARGLTIVGVSVDQDEDQYSKFIQRFAPAFTTVCDSAQQLVSAVRPSVMPTCYLIDRHGLVQVVHSGFYGKPTVRELRDEISKLLEEKP